MTENVAFIPLILESAVLVGIALRLATYQPGGDPKRQLIAIPPMNTYFMLSRHSYVPEGYRLLKWLRIGVALQMFIAILTIAYIEYRKDSARLIR
jgi:hypothetical protein